VNTEIDQQWLTDAFQRYAQTRDQRLRDEIVEHTSWLAVRSARRFSDRGEPFDDLVQVARIGLINAVDRFDPTLGVPFAAYATPTVIGEIRRYFRDHTWSLHVPRRTKDVRAAVNNAIEALSGELGRSPRVDEIATRVNLSEDAVLECLEANMAYKTRALDAPGALGIAVDDGSFSSVLDKQVVEQLLDRLQPRERTILTLRFFDELSQSEIAERVGTSQVHVGRLISASLARLRAFIDDQEVPVGASVTGESPGSTSSSRRSCSVESTMASSSEAIGP
jgi:RNA polymerase sigma-B factor